MRFCLCSFAFVLAAPLLLSGCQTIGGKTGISAEEVTAPNGLDLIKEASALNAAMAENANAGVTPAQVAETGYRMVSNSCDVYFAALIKANNRIQLTKADLTSFGTAAAVISTLTGGTAKVVGGTAALFGLASSVTSNFEQYAFATPFPVQTNQLITKALDAYSLAAPASSMVSIQQADAAVSGYARLCTFTGISVLAQQAIAAGVPVNTAGTSSIFSTSDRTQYLNNVDSLLALVGKSLDDNDYVKVSVMADSALTPTQFSMLQNTLSDNVDKAKTAKTLSAGPPPVFGPSDLLRQAATYLSLLATSNPLFTKQVAAAKAAQSTPSVAAPAASASAPAVSVKPPAAPAPAPFEAMSLPHIQIKN